MGLPLYLANMFSSLRLGAKDEPIGYPPQEDHRYVVFRMGYVVFQMGYVVFQMGYVVIRMGYVVFRMGSELLLSMLRILRFAFFPRESASS